MTRRRWWIVVATVLALVVVAGVSVVLLGTRGEDHEARARRARASGASFADALVLAPANAQRVLWTDWGAVRSALGLHLDASSSPDEVTALFDRGFDADLTSTSALESSAALLQEDFGFSPATLEWELFAQSDQAATLTMRLGGGVSTDDVATALRALQYAEPSEPGGTWRGGSDLPIAGQVTPELSFFALDRADGLVFASDQPGGVTAAVAAAKAADSTPVPATVVAGLGRPLSAAAYDATYACSALAMSGADPDEQSAADTLLAQAGKVNPVTGFGIGAVPGGAVRVTLGFDNDAQARVNADTRAKLAAGPAPGQGGDFTDRFTVRRVSAKGDLVTMDLDPVDGAYVVSDLSSGPVLFATC